MLMFIPVVGNMCQVTNLKEANDNARFPYFKQAVAIGLTTIP
jgi:hypothetical protein